MTLYNKDGTIYKLAKPNPLMHNQNLWSDQVAIHNMNWDAQKNADESNPVQSSFKPQDTFLESLEKAKQEVKEEIKEEPKEQKQTFKSENSEIQKVFIHCLPAVIKEKKDSLYGESYKTIKYSEPISFEGVILNQEDLFIQIWTDTDLVGVGSILYPRTNSKNWWRVQEKEEKKNGWLLTGILSDYQPSFINS